MDGSRSRLSKPDFLRMGLDLLVDGGPSALTAARVSKQLSVTTGSFYWHFPTVNDFRGEVKKFWLHGILIPLIAEARELAEDPGEVLEIIGRIVRQRGIVHYDRGMRSWARSDKEAKRIVAKADKIRQELIKAAFQAKCDSKETAAKKAELFGVAWLGSQNMEDTDNRFELMGMITGEAES